MADSQEKLKETVEAEDNSSVTSTDENFSILSDRPSYQEQPSQRSIKNKKKFTGFTIARIGATFIVLKVMIIVWPTDQIGNTFEIDSDLLKTHLAAFFLTGLFMIVLIIVINSEFSQAMYDMNSVMNTRFGLKNFTLKNEIYYLKDVANFDHIYRYLATIFQEGSWLDMRSKRQDPIIYLIGVLELRQVRIKDGVCDIDERIKNTTDLSKCFGEFEAKYEDKNDMSTASLDLTDQQLNDNYDLPFKYQDPNPLIPDYNGKFAVYPPGGFILTLPRGPYARVVATQKLQFLKENNWISRKTRAVFLDAVIYCPNTNFMSSVKLVFEVSPAGGVTPFLYVRTARIFLLVVKHDYFILACIAFLTMCVVYFLVEEIREIFYFKMEYFNQVSSVVDVGIITSYLLSIIYFTLVATQASPRVQEVVEHELHIPFEDIIINKRLHNHCLLVTLFFTILKITRYFPRFGILHLFAKSVKQSKMVLVWAAFLFAFINCVFTLTGFILFGSVLEEYSSLYNTCITLIRYFMFLGNYRILWEAKSMVGTGYFLTFTVLNFWLQGKFLLIIIYQTYLVCHTRLYSIRGMVLYRLLCGICVHFQHKRKLDQMIANMCKPKDNLTYEDVNTVLKVFGFTKLERDLLFKMYTLDLKQTVNASDLPLLISSIIKNQVEDYQKHATDTNMDEKQKLLMDRDDEYTPKLGVEVISTELNRLETYMDTLEEQVDALNGLTHYFFDESAKQRQRKQRRSYNDY